MLRCKDCGRMEFSIWDNRRTIQCAVCGEVQTLKTAISTIETTGAVVRHRIPYVRGQDE